MAKQTKAQRLNADKAHIFCIVGEARLTMAELYDAYIEHCGVTGNPEVLKVLLTAQEHLDKGLGDTETQLTAQFEAGNEQGRKDCMDEWIAGKEGVYVLAKALIASLENAPEQADNKALAELELWVEMIERAGILPVETKKLCKPDLKELL